MEIQDAVVLVTGASSGIGAATARALAAAGAKVVLAARRTDLIDTLAEELPDAIAVTCDVTVPGDLESAVAAGVEAYGRIDALINNAGQGLHVPIEAIKLDDFRAILELNVVATLGAMQAVIPIMRRQGAGAIVNVSSGTTKRVIPGVGAYAATKAALNTLSNTARAELAGDGIVVSTVYPTVTATEFHDVLRAGSMFAGGPDGPKGQAPEEVADVILDLLRTGEEEAVLTMQWGGPPRP